MRKPALLFTAFVLVLFLLPALAAPTPAPLVGHQADLALPAQDPSAIQPLWLQQESSPRLLAL